MGNTGTLTYTEILEAIGAHSLADKESYLDGLTPLEAKIRENILHADQQLNNSRYIVSEETFTKIKNLDHREYYRVFESPESITLKKDPGRGNFVFISMSPRPLVSWGAIARKYLKYIGAKYISEIWQQEVSHAPLPRYYMPMSGDADLTVIDLTACYWSILQAIPVRPKYYMPFYYDIKKNKILRNIIWGCLETKETSYLEYGEIVKDTNFYYSPSVVATLYNTLHAIAAEVIKTIPVLQWSADSFIVPTKWAAIAQTQLLDIWGLESHIEAQGLGRIRNIGQYWIGNKDTIYRLSNGSYGQVNETSISNIEQLDTEQILQDRQKGLEEFYYYDEINKRRAGVAIARG